MASTKKIINSFYLQDELNPEVWYNPKKDKTGNVEDLMLKPEIRERLLKIAE